MRLFRGLPAPNERVPCALTIGTFDGVHRGHQSLIQRLQHTELPVCVLTFEPHPREFFAESAAPKRLSALRDKLTALAHYGVDRVVVLRFNQRLASLSAQDFIQSVLIDGLDTRVIYLGDDFRFGAKRQGDRAMVSDYFANNPAARGPRIVGAIATLMEDDERVSSSAVRAALANNQFDRAKKLLGRPYTISGRVLHGAKLGRTLGFPTLNLRAPENPALEGIFSVRVHGLARGAIDGVASLGRRPTVENAGRMLLEIHLFDWHGNAYGKNVSVEFIAKIRDEAHYDDLDSLKAAIASDAQIARQQLSTTN